jgi:hypothetical protein
MLTASIRSSNGSRKIEKLIAEKHPIAEIHDYQPMFQLFLPLRVTFESIDHTLYFMSG